MLIVTNNPKVLENVNDIEVNMLEDTYVAIDKVRKFLRDIDLYATDDKGKPLYVDSLVIMKDMLSYIKMFQESKMYPHVITPNPEIYRSVMQRAYKNGYVAYREIEKKEFVLRSTR